VEVIVFKNISVPKAHEFNLPTPSANREENTLDLSSATSVKNAAEAGFTPLNADQLRLGDHVKSIIRSSRYNLLVHTGWRQPGLKEKNSIPVWVKGGQVYDGSFSSIDQINGVNGNNEKAGKVVISKQQLPAFGREYLYELEGQITVTLSRYLHTHAELVLRKPANPANLILPKGDSETQENQELLALQGQLLLNYSLNEQRRMRSKKLHYLDHPEFGMLVLITPYETPQESVDEVDPADTDTAIIPPPKGNNPG